MDIAPGTRLGAYEVLARLGAGGMGEVYRARDVRLGREVAVKVLARTLVGDAEAAARFEREARAVASLSHPNIVALFDVGSHEDSRFVVMELLEGETLRGRLQSTPLGWSRAARIAADVAEGLAAAHDKGIVHRDLKPENVLLTADGRVKILDFGLARKLEAPLPGDSDSLLTATRATAPGSILGTVGYMSPEQVRGDSVGPASDLFSLGCMVYEMLAGRRPFGRPTAVQSLAAVLQEEPGPLVDDRLPAPLVALVRRMLDKDPAQRPSARALAQELRAIDSPAAAPPAAHAGRVVSRRGLAWAAAVALLLAMAAAAAVFLGRRQTAFESLAILPFVNASGNPELDYLSDGIAESLINELSRLRVLRVVPRTTVFRFRGPDVDAREAGRKLQVAAVLTGRVMQRADVLSVQTDLIDVARDAQLWGERYERKAGDALALQGEIARTIAAKLRPELSPEAQTRLQRGTTQDDAAYQLYLKGLHNWNKFTPDGGQRAIGYYRQAIEKDPGYALAHAGLANAYFTVGFFAAPPRELMPQAAAAAEAALARDDALAEAHVARGLVRLYYDWNRSEAEASLARALELDPHSSIAHQIQAYYLAGQRRFAEALAEIERARALDPLSLVINADVGLICGYAGDNARALVEVKKAVALDPDFPRSQAWLMFAYEQNGLLREGLEVRKSMLARRGDSAGAQALEDAYRRAGQRGVLEQSLVRLAEATKTRYVSPYDFAVTYAQLGRKDEAFAWLEKSYEARASAMAQLTVEPLLRAVRGDPRLRDLVRRVGVQPLD